MSSTATLTITTPQIDTMPLIDEVRLIRAGSVDRTALEESIELKGSKSRSGKFSTKTGTCEDVVVKASHPDAQELAV